MRSKYRALRKILFVCFSMKDPMFVYPQTTQMVQQLRIRPSKYRLVYHQFHKLLSNKHCLIQYSSSILSSAFCQKTVFSLKIMFSCSLGNLVCKGKFENILHYETWVIHRFLNLCRIWMLLLVTSLQTDSPLDRNYHPNRCLFHKALYE